MNNNIIILVYYLVNLLTHVVNMWVMYYLAKRYTLCSQSLASCNHLYHHIVDFRTTCDVVIKYNNRTLILNTLK